MTVDPNAFGMVTGKDDVDAEDETADEAGADDETAADEAGAEDDAADAGADDAGADDELAAVSAAAALVGLELLDELHALSRAAAATMAAPVRRRRRDKGNSFIRAGVGPAGRQGGYGIPGRR